MHVGNGIPRSLPLVESHHRTRRILGKTGLREVRLPSLPTRGEVYVPGLLAEQVLAHDPLVARNAQRGPFNEHLQHVRTTLTPGPRAHLRGREHRRPRPVPGFSLRRAPAGQHALPQPPHARAEQIQFRRTFRHRLRIRHSPITPSGHVVSSRIPTSSGDKGTKRSSLYLRVTASPHLPITPSSRYTPAPSPAPYRPA